MQPEKTTTARLTRLARSFFVRLALAAAILFLFAVLSRAGGPQYVAGTMYFDSSTTGQPLVWPQGIVTYYTDQGDLSPILPNASANSFVSGAFAQWTAVPTAALAITSGGQLAEDVNGTNVTLNSNGTISMPADIQSATTGTPVGVVYDLDGSVTDALLGAGAGDASQCFSNAVFGGNDNYGTMATFRHALIVINGQCAQESSQLTDVEYRLVRVIGRVLGLGWSQVNVNVQTRVPVPTSDDYLGFPVMHFIDPLNCVPITICYPNPYQLAMDDVASLSRLYPVTAQNQANFAGSQIFSAVTARIHGSVWFSDPQGDPAQPMQGVNVVARWIDPATNLPSRRYAAATVSGFLFSGNQGNTVTGFYDALGDPLAEWGSNSPTLEGFFDLAGLLPPNGTSAQYQLSVEALDPAWSTEVGSYSPGPVAPSGLAQPIIVTVALGNDVEQDIVMGSTAQAMPQATSTWTTPAALPLGGDWESTLSGYGDISYFLLAAQANRTLSVAVTAFDENGNPSLLKAQPVIGMWAASDPQGTAAPAFTPSPFNQLEVGETRLDATINASTNFLIGISDLRGDGRPDYRYHSYVLYADNVAPARVGVNGGAVTVRGTGFNPSLTAAIGSMTSPPVAINAGQMILTAPPQKDGSENISISDPVSGGSSTMTGALTYGAAATDNVVLLSGLNPPTPVGTQATNPVRVRVLAADGVTPVSGATVAWSGSNQVQLSACAGTTSCSVTSDESGYAITWLTPASLGVAGITATLAPASYNPAKSVTATVNAIESASNIGVSQGYLWIAQGATVSIPLSARVLSNGTPQGNVTVNFNMVSGSGTLSAASGQTNATGYASVTLTVTQLATSLQMNACVAAGNGPCQPVYATPVPLPQQNLQAVSGEGQVSTGQPFQPVLVRVTDSSSPPNSVIAANVAFLTTVLRPVGASSSSGGVNPVLPVILNVSQSSVTTDLNGLATTTPSADGFGGPLEVDVNATAGVSSVIDFPLELYPALTSPNGEGQPSRSPVALSPWGILRPAGNQTLEPGRGCP